MQMFKPDASTSGGGSGTGKNYLSSYNNNPGNGDFEAAATTGFSLGTTGTLTNGLPTGTPSFGSGASGNLALALVSSGKLAGSYSASYTSSAATTAGNMLASSAFTIDIEDQVKILNFSFAYKAQTNGSNANWSGTSSNSFGVAIYDVTASAWIIPVGCFSMIQSTGVGIASGFFQTTSTSTQYRIVVYNANATAGTITVYFDDFSVGPASVSPSSGAVIAQASGDPASAASGNPIIFPTVNFDSTASYNSSTGRYTAPLSGYYQVYGALRPGATNVGLFIYVNAVSTVAAGYTSNDGVFTGSVKVNSGDLIDLRPNGTYDGGSGSVINFQLVQSAAVGPAGQVVAARAKVSVGASTGASSPINFDSVDFDTTGSITTGASWNYKAPITGYYWVATNFFYGAGGLNPAVYKNGSIYAGILTNNSSPGAGGTLVQLNAGDTVDFRPNSGTGIPTAYTSVTVPQGNYISIFLLQGASAAQPSNATVAASYWVSANFAASTTVPINFDSKEFDTMNAVTTSATAWKFTAPVSGLYLVVASSIGNVGAGAKIYKNGSAYKAAGGISTGVSQVGEAVASFYLNAGEYFDLRPITACTVTGGALATDLVANINIVKVG